MYKKKSLFYKKLGNGPPILILHGLLGSADNWTTIAKHLSSDYTCYLIDLRNHGRSFHSEHGTLQVMAKDIIWFIQQHHLTDCTIIGHSMGGKVAMELSQISPTCMAKLVVVDIMPNTMSIDQFMPLLIGLNKINPQNYTTRKSLDQMLISLIPSTSFRQYIMKNIGRNDQGFFWRPNLKAIINNLQKICEKITLRHPFYNPTLFIRGGLSDYINLQYLEPIHTMFPNYTLESITQAGHWVHQDQPTLCLTVLKNFLQQHNSTQYTQ